MFENPGGKIKVIAIIAFIIECIGAFIVGISASASNPGGLIGILIIIGGILASYVLNLFFYAFGDLVEKMTKTESNTRK